MLVSCRNTLAERAGHTTALIDLDPQSSAAKWRDNRNETSRYREKYDRARDISRRIERFLSA